MTDNQAKAVTFQGNFDADVPNEDTPESDEFLDVGLPSLGKMPSKLTAAQQRAWRNIVAAAPPGVLKSADRIIVEQAAICMAKVREGFHYNASKELRACLAQLQMTPQARDNLKKGKGSEKTNPFATD